MSISGDLKVFGTFAASSPKQYHHQHQLQRPLLPPSKVHFVSSFGGSRDLRIMPKWPQMESPAPSKAPNSCFGIGGNKLSASVYHDAEGFLVNVVNMSFLDRLSLAWKILFPAVKATRNSNASIAKQRLKMILFSDRCAVSDEARKKIVSNIIETLSEFIEIDSRDQVQLNVSTDTDLGTVYSVTVPVRRVKPQYQESEEDYRGKITNIEYKDTGESSGTVDVKFDFFIPYEN